MKANYHTHTKRCLHAQGTEEDYIQAALEAGVSVLGFSDHAPFPDYDYGYRMPYSELESYFSAIDRLAKVHASDIAILKGLEIEYTPGYGPYYEKILEQYQTDYLILGEHFFCDEAGELYYISQATDTESYPVYAQVVADAMRTGYFQIVAHPDLFAMNQFVWDKNCDIATDIILEAAAATDTILEFNANGLRRGLHDYPDGRRYMYPHMNFWNRVSGSGIRVIIGSDCHEPCQVWDACMPKAQQILKEIGIKPTEFLREN